MANPSMHNVEKNLLARLEANQKRRQLKKTFIAFFFHYPLLRIVFVLALGIVCADAFYHQFSSIVEGLFVGACVCAAAMYYMVRLQRTTFLFGLFYSFVFFLTFTQLGALLLLSQRDSSRVDWSGEARVYEVLVSDVPKPTKRTYRVNAVVLEGEESGRKVQLTLMREAGDTLHVGDVVACYGVMASPVDAGNPGDFDYARWLKCQGISGVMFCSAHTWKLSTHAPPSMPFRVRALQVRERMIAEYRQYFEGRDFGIMAAMTLGDKTLLDAEVREIYSQGGVSHVLALSGLHLTVIVFLFHFLMRRLKHRRWLFLLCNVLVIAFVWGYVFISGVPLSLLRAAVMFSILQLMQCFRRDSLSLNNLALAAFLILLFSPDALFDVGFQLSFLSVFAILLLMPCMRYPVGWENNSVLRYICDTVAMTIFAQLGTIPLVLYYFHIFPVYSIPINVLIVALGNVVLGLMVAFWALPFLRWLIAWVVESVLSLMEQILSFFLDLPYATLRFYPDGFETCVLYALIIGITAYCCFYRHRRLLVGLGGVTVVWVFYIAFISPRQVREHLVFYRLQEGVGVHAIFSADSSYLFTNMPNKVDSVFYHVRKNFWEPRQLQEPTVLHADYADGSEFCKDGHLLVGDKHIVVLCESLPSHAISKPLAVDYLLLARGCRDSLSHIAAFYMPSKLVLNADLGWYVRERYQHQADSLQWSVHDLSRQGALVVRNP